MRFKGKGGDGDTHTQSDRETERGGGDTHRVTERQRGGGGGERLTRRVTERQIQTEARLPGESERHKAYNLNSMHRPMIEAEFTRELP